MEPADSAGAHVAVARDGAFGEHLPARGDSGSAENRNAYPRAFLTRASSLSDMDSWLQ